MQNRLPYREELDAFICAHPYRYIGVEGGTFRYVLAGPSDKQTLVFLNGGMNCSEMWMRYVELLSGRYQLLLFDYSQDFPDNQSQIAGMHRLFEKLKIKRPVLIGASFGGMAAQLYTQRYPDDVSSLILLATGGLDRRTIASLKRKYVLLPLLLVYMKHCNYEKMKEKLKRSSCKRFENADPADQAYMAEMFNTLFEDYPREKDLHITGLLADLGRQTPVTPANFQGLAGRVLLILPNKDFFSEAMQKDLTALMHSPKVKIVSGSHLSTVLRPQDHCREILAFLSELGL